MSSGLFFVLTSRIPEQFVDSEVLAASSQGKLCNPMDWSMPGSPVPGTLQARTLEWVAMPSSRGSSRPREQTCISCTAGTLFTTEPPGSSCVFVFRGLKERTQDSKQHYQGRWIKKKQQTNLHGDRDLHSMIELVLHKYLFILLWFSCITIGCIYVTLPSLSMAVPKRCFR